MALKAMELALPAFFTAEEFRPFLYTWGFISVVGVVLSIMIWVKNRTT